MCIQEVMISEALWVWAFEKFRLTEPKSSWYTSWLKVSRPVLHQGYIVYNQQSLQSTQITVRYSWVAWAIQCNLLNRFWWNLAFPFLCLGHCCTFVHMCLFCLYMIIKNALAIITSYSPPHGFRIQRCFSCRDTQIVWNTNRSKLDNASNSTHWNGWLR